MDILLIVFGFCCMLIGIAGSILPVIPGLIVSWLGLVLLHCTSIIPMNYTTLGLTLAVIIIINLIQYLIPAQTTKKYGGSRYAIWGTNLGLLIGILSPIPFGFIIGPFVGAFIGELIHNNQNHQKAFKVATGSFIGFLFSTFLNFMLSIVLLGWFLSLLWQYRGQL